MKFSIYSTETNEVVAVINGESNKECEGKAEEMGYMNSTDFGGTYADMSVDETENTVYVEV